MRVTRSPVLAVARACTFLLLASGCGDDTASTAASTGGGGDGGGGSVTAGGGDDPDGSSSSGGAPAGNGGAGSMSTTTATISAATSTGSGATECPVGPCSIPENECALPQACGDFLAWVSSATELPEPQGGAIPDGRYILTSVVLHTGVGGSTEPPDPEVYAPMRGTWDFRATEYDKNWTYITIDCVENVHARRASYTLGDGVILGDQTCPPVGEGVPQLADRYTYFENGELHVFWDILAEPIREVWSLQP